MSGSKQESHERGQNDGASGKYNNSDRLTIAQEIFSTKEQSQSANEKAEAYDKGWNNSWKQR